MCSRSCPSALGIVSLALVLGCLRAHADPGETSATKADLERARVIYNEGEAAYRVGRFDEAAARYEESYRIIKVPMILFDIAQSLRRWDETGNQDLRRLKKALDLYQTFVREAPTARQRPIALQLIPELEARIAAETRRQRDALVATASGMEGVALSDRLVEEGARMDAAQVLDRVLASSRNPREVIVAALTKRGLLSCALGEPVVAVEAFKRALVLDPALVLPAAATPATRDAYAQARKALEGRKPLAIGHVPPGAARQGRPARIAIAVLSDPLEMIHELAVRYRVAGAGAYSTSSAPKASGEIEIPASLMATLQPGSRIEYYLAALDEEEGELTTLGSPTSPFVFHLAADSAAVVAAQPRSTVTPALPLYKRWWLWAAVGAAAVVGVAAGVGGYYGTLPNNPPAVPLPTR